MSIAVITKAKENDNTMLTFPPHTSHKLQPLKRCVFRPFKKYCNAACSSWMLTNPGKPISIHNVGHLIGVADPSAFNPCNIQSGFCVSGLWPVNADIFRDDEYLSSYVTDRPEPTD
jgi:hypothetical protein